MNKATADLRTAIHRVSRDELDELTIEELEQMSIDLHALGAIASVAAASQKWANQMRKSEPQ